MISFKSFLILLLFFVVSVLTIGFFIFLTSPTLAPGILLSFLSGLSMIFLPCTFPLVFIIVPLALSKNPKKGFLMAISFGVGLTITFSLYGLLLGWIGGFVELYKIVQYMLLIGGIIALFFGLSELRLIKFQIPFKQTILPQSLQNKNDYVKSFFLGFFLGNAGVGCPNPAFYILFGYVAVLGDPLSGLYLGAIHGLGRFIPLIFLVILALVGINMSNYLVKYQPKVKRIVAWTLVVLGAFILNYGIFGMAWFEESAIHKLWNEFILNVFPKAAESSEIESKLNLPEGTGGIFPWIFLGFIIGIVMIWDAFKKRLNL